MSDIAVQLLNNSINYHSGRIELLLVAIVWMIYLTKK